MLKTLHKRKRMYTCDYVNNIKFMLEHKTKTQQQMFYDLWRLHLTSVSL